MIRVPPVAALLIATVTTLAVTAPASAKSASDIRREAIEHRSATEQRDIAEGRRDGGLTWWEKLRLEREQRRIGALERRALSDGVISKGEYRAIRHEQVEAAEHIRQERNNEYVRGWWWRAFLR